MREQESYLEMVCRWIDSGQLNRDKPRTEDEARQIAFDLLEM